MRLWCFLLSALLFPAVVSAQQITIQGRVIDAETHEPVPFATVYVNKTTSGEASSLAGEFSFNYSIGTGEADFIEVIASCVGYKTATYLLAPENYGKALVFRLTPQQELLNEISVTAERDQSWYYNLATFKQYFLGESSFGKACKILNEKDMIIDYNPATDLLKVISRKPLLIKNEMLGYAIRYNLEMFEFKPKTGKLNFAGSSFYQNTEGNKRQVKKWNKNRIAAYEGSLVHFLKLAYAGNLPGSDFEMRRLYRVPNKNYATEEEIVKAKKEAKALLRQGKQIPEGTRDVLDRAKKHKFVQYLDTNAVVLDSLFLKVDDALLFNFEHYLQVVYLGEKEEQAYLRSISGTFKDLPQPGYQTSVVSLPNGATEINVNGTTSHTFDLLLEGYWAWERLGEMLPLDYTLPAAN